MSPIGPAPAHTFASAELTPHGILRTRCERRTVTWLLTYALTAFGVVPLVTMPVLMLVQEFKWSMAPSALVGIPFILLSLLYRKHLNNNWGYVEISQAGVRWQQGKELRGSWPLAAVRGIVEPIAFNSSYRVVFERERWLMLVIGEQRVPLFFGTQNERQWLRGALAGFGIR